MSAQRTQNINCRSREKNQFSPNTKIFIVFPSLFFLIILRYTFECWLLFYVCFSKKGKKPCHWAYVFGRWLNSKIIWSQQNKDRDAEMHYNKTWSLNFFGWATPPGWTKTDKRILFFYNLPLLENSKFTRWFPLCAVVALSTFWQRWHMLGAK